MIWSKMGMRILGRQPLKFSGIRHVCRFPLLFRLVAAKVNQSGWVILPHDNLVVVWKMKLKCQITAIGVKNRLACPHQSMAKFSRDFSWRSNSQRSAYKIARCVAVGFSISLKTCRPNPLLLRFYIYSLCHASHA